MGYVRGYYRRSAGGGAVAGSAPKRLSVDIYGADGVTLLRDRGGARYTLESLNFDTVLPGGYMSASFVLRRFVSGIWPGRAGLKVIIRRGEKILWMGWIEDIQRTQKGRIEEISVSCLGPWQVLQQRVNSFDYTGTVYGNDALKINLLTCPEISTNDDYLEATGVSIADLAWTHKYISDLVKLICETGNSSDQQMLFAIWEPKRQMVARSYVLNGGFEIPGASAAVAPKYWTWAGTILGWGTATTGHSGYASVLAGDDDGGSANIYQNDVPCLESTAYTCSFWAKNSGESWAWAGVYFKINWKNGAGTTLSSTTGTTRTPGTSWTQYTESATSPAGATKFQIYFYFANVHGVYLDDVSVYAAEELDTLPVAHLWARDLSAADYLLHTARLDDALQVDTTTRELVNNILVSYGSTPDYTAAGEDAKSQADYRQRDMVMDAGEDATATVAAGMRDAQLARYKDPLVEPKGFKLSRPGALTTAHGGRVWPEDVRAGDRIKIADGPHAGNIVLLKQVSYADGVVTYTPEGPANLPVMLAQGQAAASGENRQKPWWMWWWR